MIARKSAIHDEQNKKFAFNLYNFFVLILIVSILQKWWETFWSYFECQWVSKWCNSTKAGHFFVDFNKNLFLKYMLMKIWCHRLYFLNLVMIWQLETLWEILHFKKLKKLSLEKCWLTLPGEMTFFRFAFFYQKSSLNLPFMSKSPCLLIGPMHLHKRKGNICRLLSIL